MARDLVRAKERFLERRRIAQEYVAKIRSETICKRCLREGEPIEWHHDDHLILVNQRVSGLATRGHTIERIQQEIDKCDALCRSCHMIVDHRLDKLRIVCPNQKGVIFVGKLPCDRCGQPCKPLRKGLCNACNHKKRAGKLF